MQQIAEAFLESSWVDAATACAARDTRAAQLEAAGYDCDCANLWNLAGYRVYVLRAEPPETKRTAAAKPSEAKRVGSVNQPAANRRSVNPSSRAPQPNRL
jgi:hypothetical protein